MALKFWDYLNLSIIMGIHDYYEEEEKRKEKEQAFFARLYEEIADAAEKIFYEANEVFKKANPNAQPEGALSGALTLPFYAFMQVLSMQESLGKKISPEQDRLLDVFFKSLNIGVSKCLRLLLSPDLKKRY